MTLATGAWGQDTVAQNGKDMRQLVEGLRGVDGITTKPGFHLGFKASAQGSPNATVSVALGYAMVTASGAGLGGMYHVWNDAAINSPSFAATSGNGRWDYLILRVTAGVPALEIVQGTASGSPVAPTITGDNYLPIALVKLPASVSAVTSNMINDARVFTGKWAEPWGFMGTAIRTTTLPVNAETVLCQVDITVVKNRLLKITGIADGASTTQAIFWRVAIRDVSGSTGNFWITGGSTTCPGAQNPASVTVVGIEATTANENKTFQLTGTTGSAGGYCGAAAPGAGGSVARVLVEDIGPAANPD